jgi:pro-apoptotic serine protease NMA111
MNGSNGTPRTKRKQHPGEVDERPQKQYRAINGKESAGENTPEVASVFEEELEIEEPRILAAMADTAEWQAAIEKVVRNVVSIRFCQTCSFDTDPALTSEATGFVVDAERG